MFKIIVCLNKKGVIGKDGKLLYHIKNDSSNFKSITSGNVVIMGRKTFESLPKKSPLPNRVNIIITSDENYCVEASENVYIVHSVKDAVEMSKSLFSDKEVFVIGGESIYKQFLNGGEVSEMFLTIVHDGQMVIHIFHNIIQTSGRHTTSPLFRRMVTWNLNLPY